MLEAACRNLCNNEATKCRKIPPKSLTFSECCRVLDLFFSRSLAPKIHFHYKDAAEPWLTQSKLWLLISNFSDPKKPNLQTTGRPELLPKRRLCLCRKLNKSTVINGVSIFSKLAPSITFPLLLQILELVKGMHYQLACQKYFELTHNVSANFIWWGLCHRWGGLVLYV